MKRGKRREIQQSGTGRVGVEAAIRMARHLGFVAERAPNGDKLQIKYPGGHPIGWLAIDGDDCVSWSVFDTVTGLGKPLTPKSKQ